MERGRGGSSRQVIPVVIDGGEVEGDQRPIDFYGGWDEGPVVSRTTTRAPPTLAPLEEGVPPALLLLLTSSSVGMDRPGGVVGGAQVGVPYCQGVHGSQVASTSSTSSSVAVDDVVAGQAGGERGAESAW